MKILHKYLLKQLIGTLFMSLLIFTFLFLVLDFFDRIDNILSEHPSVLTVTQYFMYKIPLMVSLMLPVAMLVAILFTIGLLSKNSEITAMRASGLTILWIGRPLFYTAFALSLGSLLLNETLIPYCARRVREIYNIDIKAKDKKGAYSQSDIWWRAKNSFFSVSMFDSRNNALVGLSQFDLDENFNVLKRTDAHDVNWIDPVVGWNMQQVTEYSFTHPEEISSTTRSKLPLPISKKPQEFYDSETDPQTMSYGQLQRFIKAQENNGLPVSSYFSDLYNKVSFPFVTFIVSLTVLPFALQPARSGSMAGSIIGALIIGFSYHVVHSLCLSFGRAEIIPALLAAWSANVLLFGAGLILLSGAEAPR